MSNLNINSTTTTDLSSAISDYSIGGQTLDSANNLNETYYDIENANKYLAYYKTIPELKKAIDALAMWTSGKGYTADERTQIILEGVKGWGEDSFEAILNNLIICKKVYGDAFAQIIRDEDGRLINIKPLDPANIRIVTDKKGIIKRYEQKNKQETKKFQPQEILHICNDRIGDEIHGVSVIDACQWVIDARQEAMADWRKVLHRNVVPLRIIEVDSDDTTKLSTLKTQYQNAISKGEVLVIPKGNVAITETSPQLQDPQSWIRYLENFFYQAVGIPKVVLGGSEEFTESSAKVGYLTFEQVYSKEQRELEADLWGQVGLRIKFNKPASLRNEMLTSEAKEGNPFKPNDTQLNMSGEA